jgi:hypothetical protein
VISRLRGESRSSVLRTPTPIPSRPMSMAGTDQYSFPTEPRGPYMHHPTYRVAHEDDHSTSHGGPLSVDTEVESDEDEDTRQRRIEEEMGRREVSIVTVPKRKLWITNPS